MIKKFLLINALVVSAFSPIGAVDHEYAAQIASNLALAGASAASLLIGARLAQLVKNDYDYLNFYVHGNAAMQKSADWEVRQAEFAKPYMKSYIRRLKIEVGIGSGLAAAFLAGGAYGLVLLSIK